MKRIAIVAALALLAACAKGDKTNATDTSAVGGSVAPAATDSSGSSMSGSTYSDSLRKSDSAHMAAGSNPSGMGDSSQNQTQSGVTDSSGNSTLGPNASKMTPTSKQPVTAKGDTLKKPPTP